jgi:type I restriction enzyme R subunit
LSRTSPTASPSTSAAHTAAYFSHKAFAYGYDQAVKDGYLVDYDAVNVRSDVRMNGVFLKEGDRVEQVDPQTGLSRMDTLEDERAFDTTEIERRITAPHSNRLILEELKKYADEHERRYGRFPKTLVFAANDLPHTSHADQLVDTARDVFGRARPSSRRSRAGWTGRSSGSASSATGPSR